MRQRQRWIATLLAVCGLLLVLSGLAVAQDREAQLAEAKRLSQQVTELHQAGRYAEAIPLAQRSLAIVEKALGPEHPDVALALNNLASLYQDTGDYARAEPLLQRALTIYVKVLGKEHPFVATALNNLADLYHVTGDYAKAEPLLQRALTIDEKVYGPEHPDVATTLNNLASLYQDTGDYARAEPLFQRSLTILEKVLRKEHPNVANSLNNLARLYQDMGDYAKAEPLLQRALTIYVKVLGKEHPFVATALNNLARLYQDMGDYAKAEPLRQSTLAILEKVLGPEHPDVATALNNLASLYQDTGDYARAEPLLQRALTIYVKVLGKEHPFVATALNNLARLYQATGDYPRAEPLHQRALTIREKALGPEHPDVAQSLNNLAALYQATGDYARALPLYQRSLAIREKVYGPEHPDVATALNNLATLYQATGDYPHALSFSQRAADVREQNIDALLDTGSQQQKQLYLNTLSGETTATVSLHAQDLPQNAEAARLALTTILRRKGRALDAFTSQLEALRRRANPDDKKWLDDLVVIQSQLANLQLNSDSKLTPDARRAEVARLTAEQERMEDAIGRRSAEFRTVRQPVTLERVQAAIPADAVLVELFVYKPFNAKAKTVAERFSAARYVAYVVRQQDAVPQFVDLGEAAPIDTDIERLRSLLGHPPLRKKDETITDAELQARMQQHEAQAKELARNLDERVMRPVRKLLGETKRVFLSPDAALNLIPFEALVDENGHYLIENYSFNYLTSGRDLLRLQVPIESRNTPAVWANPLYDMAAAGPPADNAENRRSMDFQALTYPPLPGTAEEASAVGRLWPEMQVWTQAQATEAALKQVQSPRFLHIATHGFFEPDQPRELPPAGPASGRATLDTLSLPPAGLPNNQVAPQPSGNPQSAVRNPQWENPLLRSGLVLAGVKQLHSGAGADGKSEDGVVTALETAGLDLWGTRLVVLSACETGLGDVQNGQGVYGLRRALVLAGSQTQVMSLWKVSDEGTRDLMAAYYTRLKAGEGRIAAMRQVQLAMLRGELKPSGGATDYRHPYYWAAFIPSGDWRSMDGSDGSFFGWRAVVATVCGGALIALLVFLYAARKRIFATNDTNAHK